jgi:hypothetical protein
MIVQMTSSSGKNEIELDAKVKMTSSENSNVGNLECSIIGTSELSSNTEKKTRIIANLG